MARVRLDKPKVKSYGLFVAGRHVERACRGTESVARQLVPVKTANLQRSLGWSIRIRGFTVIGKVGSEKDYSKVVHEGAKPHIIRPRYKKSLKFQWHGQTVFFRKVSHPGIGATPYLTAAMRIVVVPLGFRVERNLPARFLEE